MNRNAFRSLLGVLVLFSSSLQAQILQFDTTAFRNLHIAGQVKTMVKKGDTLLIGGGIAGAGTRIEATIGFNHAKQQLPQMPWMREGWVTAITPDGEGGYFFGGSFRDVNGEKRKGLTRINSNGSVHPFIAQEISPGVSLTNPKTIAVTGDTLLVGMNNNYLSDALNSFAAWDDGAQQMKSQLPAVDGEVYTIVGDGNGGYFLGGKFRHVGDSLRSNIAHFNSSGTITAFNPNPDKPVYRLLYNGNVLYVGGAFTTIGGAARNLVAALDPVSGTATAWNANVIGSNLEAQGVKCLLVSGTNLYIGGYITQVGGQSRQGIAQVTLATGAVTSWNGNGVGVNAIDMVLDGTSVIVTGNFGSPIAAKKVDGTTAAVIWTIPLQAGQVFDLALNNGILYVGGAFESIGGAARVNLGAFDAATGLVTNFAPVITYPFVGTVTRQPIRSIVISNGALYVAGAGVRLVNGQGRNGIAAVSLATGNTLPFDPDPVTLDPQTIGGRNIYVIEYLNGLHVFGGGGINMTASRSFLYAFNKQTGNRVLWNSGINGSVYNITRRGSRIFINGAFTSVLGQPRAGLAALDAQTLQLLPWNPATGASFVNELAWANGQVYAAGSFSGGRKLIQIDSATQTVLAWAPVISGGNGEVRSIKILNGTLYAGGYFTSVNTTTRSHIAAFSLATGNLTNLFMDMNGPVDDVQAYGNSIFLSGFFTQVGATARSFFVEADAVTGQLTNWDLNMGFGDGSYSGRSYVDDNGIVIYQTNTIWGPVKAKSLLAYDLTNERLIPLPPAFQQDGGPINSLLVDGSTLYVGGQFSTIAGVARSNFAAIDLNNFSITNLTASPNASVYTLALQGNTIFMGGDFTTINGTTRNRAGAIDKTTGALAAWNPNADSRVSKILPDGNTIYVGGRFSTVSGQSKPGFAATALATGVPTAVPFTSVGAFDVFDMVKKGNTLYIGGVLGSVPSYGVVARDVSTGLATSWLPQNSTSDASFVNPGVTALQFHPVSNTIFIGSMRVDKVGGLTSNGLAEVSLADGKALPYNVQLEQYYNQTYAINSMVTYGNTLIVGGLFPSINNTTRSAVAAFRIMDCAHSAVITPSGATTFCEGGNLVLNANVAAGAKYQWFRNDSALLGATAATLTTPVWGKYGLRVEVGGCIKSASPVVVTVNPIPATPVITQSGNTLFSSATTGNQWYLNAGSIAGATAPQYTATVSGLYTVRTTRLGCTSAAPTALNVVVTAIAGPGAEPGMQAYPNPATEKALLSFGRSGRYAVQLFDLQGRELLYKVFSGTTGELVVSALPSGSYALLITNLNTYKKSRLQLVKQ